MSTPEDAELARTLDLLMAQKRQAQRRSWAWFALTLALALLAGLARHRLWILLPSLGAALASLQFGVRAHLRADALRGQAMERIVKEAFRRAGQASEDGEA